MPSKATGKWPRLQFIIHCKTCDKTIKFSINYGSNNIWSQTAAAKLAEWASHDGHEVEVNYEFFEGYDPTPRWG
jgi:hypothetical protein